MIRMPVSLIALFALILCLTGADPARAQDNTPVAAVGPYVVTQGEIDAALPTRGRSFTGDFETVRRKLRDTLIAEYWVDQNYAELVGDNPLVAAAMGEARRQVLFEIYTQSSFTPPDPGAEEIAAYIAARPDLFENRAIYRFEGLQAAPQTPEQQAQLTDLLARAAQAPDQEGLLSDLAVELTARGIPVSLFRNWAGSEELAETTRAQLDAMANSGQMLDQSIDENGVTLLLLHSRRPAPADPDLLTEQVRNRLIQQAYVDHRNSLATTIAEPLLGAEPQAVVIRDLSQTKLIAIGALGALLGLALAAQLPWNRRAREHVIKARRDLLDEDIATLRRPLPVTLMSLLAALLSVALTGAILWLLGGMRLLTLESLAAFFGLWLLAFVFGWLIWRGTAEDVSQSRRALAWAERRVGLLLLLLVAGVAVLIALPDLPAQLAGQG